MPDHSYFANLIWQIADLLRGPYRPPQYERVMLPMTVLRRFDCVLAPSRDKVVAEYERRKDKLDGPAPDLRLNRTKRRCQALRRGRIGGACACAATSDG